MIPEREDITVGVVRVEGGEGWVRLLLSALFFGEQIWLTTTLTPAEARRLAKWLTSEADKLTKQEEAKE